MREKETLLFVITKRPLKYVWRILIYLGLGSLRGYEYLYLIYKSQRITDNILIRRPEDDFCAKLECTVEAETPIFSGG